MLGGHALKSVNTRRFNKVEFNELAKDIGAILNDFNIQYAVTTSYRKKETFGDLDILLYKNESIDMIKLREIVGTIFEPKETYKNGNCYSFDYKEFQIDMILIHPEEWDTSIVYFSYNDLGNFMGRTARDLGFRYGAYGLAYDSPNGGRIIASTDSKKIFEFLGYDYERYLKGFDTMEEIFQYVVDSKYFNKRSFAYENLNHVNRSRNLKRKSYVSFMEYIQNVEKPDFNFEPKQTYLDYALKFFTGDLHDNSFEDKWINFHHKLKIKEESHNLFNGKIIGEYYPSLEKKRYTQTIKNYKDSVINFIAEDDDLAFEIYTLEIGDTDDLMREFGLVNKLKLEK